MTDDCTRTGRTLLDMLSSGRIDWRFPNDAGLFDRNLDCRQLAVMEVLRWKGISDPGRIFIDYLDCTSEGMLLRRKEPELQNGWRLAKLEEIQDTPEDTIENQIKHVFDAQGYCLLYYRAFDMTFSSYYNQHDVIHWALVAGYDAQHIIMLDSAASPSFVRKPFSYVPWKLFHRDWDQSAGGGLAVIERTDGHEDEGWQETIRRLVRQSVAEMAHNGGLCSLRSFIQELAAADPAELVDYLDRVEFDIHYYRRLRELWRLLLEKGTIPQSLVRAEWAEELVYLSKSWSFVLGVVMKWKKQRSRDYRDKVVDYLWQAYESESRLIHYFDLLIRKEGSEGVGNGA